MLITIGEAAAPAPWLVANLATLLPAAITVGGGVFALWQWRIDQNWKRITTALERIRSFDETPGTRNAMMILKSPTRPIPLYDPREPPDKLYAPVTWDEAKWALLPTASNPLTDRKHNAIRDSFEDFMNRMTQIEMYLAAGRLTEKQVCLLVEPWAKRLDGRIDDGGLTRNFRLYVAAEHKTGVVRLFGRFGVDLTPTDADRAALAADLAGREA